MTKFIFERQGQWSCTQTTQTAYVHMKVKVYLYIFFFTGHTDDFNYMIENLLERYPNTKLILVGFSLGGNVITKYLGEERKRPKNIIGGISICQGYNAIEWVIDCLYLEPIYYKKLQILMSLLVTIKTHLNQFKWTPTIFTM